MEHAFASEFTVGVEEELFGQPAGARAAHEAERLLPAIERSGGWEADHEAFACEVELRSPLVATPGEALAELAAADHRPPHAGATTMGAGLHPSASSDG